MQSLLLSTIYNALRLYVGSGLFNRIIAQVIAVSTSQVSGQEKMAMVLEFAKREAMNLSETLIRAVVEVFLLKQSA